MPLATAAATNEPALVPVHVATGRGHARAVGASGPVRASAAQRSLRSALRSGLRAAGRYSGAYVMDLTTGRALFSSAGSVPRLPASVEKIYTTSTALLRFGADTRLSTTVLGDGAFDPVGGWHGTLYLKG